MTSRRILALGAIVAFGATALAVLSPSSFSVFDLRIQDGMLRAAHTRPPSGRVVIVAIDDRSLSEIGQWPWPRDVLARLIDGIRRLGARVIAIDVLLAEPDRFRSGDARGTPSTDSALAAVLTEGRVVMSYALTFDAGPPDAGGCVLHPIAPVLVDGPDGRSPGDLLFHAAGVTCSLPEFNRSARSSGYLNAAADPDGLLRRVPLLMDFKGRIYPSLSLAAVIEAAGAKRLVLTGLAGGRTRLVVDDRPVPLDERGTLLLRFRGKSGTFPRVAACDVLGGRATAGSLKDRIVFLGTTALGIQDVVPTLFDAAMWGIEVHATAADTLVQRDFVSRPPYSRAYELLATLVLGFIAAVLVAVIGFPFGGALSAGMVALLWWMTFRWVGGSGVFLSPVLPSVSVIAVILSLTFARLGHERRRAEAERGRRERAQRFAVQSLTALMETRDGATGRHARRTQQYSRLLATHLARLPRFRDSLTPECVDMLSRLSPLHDIGKVAVRDAVLRKPGPLSEEEITEMHQHPGLGYETIAKAERLAGGGGAGSEALIKLAKDIVYTHHERWDGHGYPCGLKGEEIPIAGRIVALVDVYDALTDLRIYRGRLTHEQAVALLTAGRGTQFDPDVVDAFLAVQERFRELAIEFASDRPEEPADRFSPA